MPMLLPPGSWVCRLSSHPLGRKPVGYGVGCAGCLECGPGGPGRGDRRRSSSDCLLVVQWDWVWCFWRSWVKSNETIDVQGWTPNDENEIWNDRRLCGRTWFAWRCDLYERSVRKVQICTLLPRSRKEHASHSGSSAWTSEAAPSLRLVSGLPFFSPFASITSRSRHCCLKRVPSTRHAPR